MLIGIKKMKLNSSEEKKELSISVLQPFISGSIRSQTFEKLQSEGLGEKGWKVDYKRIYESFQI